MTYSKDLMLWLAGVLTAVSVMAVSALYFWGKAFFVEMLLWQTLILVCVVVVCGPTSQSSQSPIRRALLWVMLAAILIMSWRVDVDIFTIYTIIWIACCAYYVSTAWAWFWMFAVNVAWLIIRHFSWEQDQVLISTLLLGTFHLFAMLSSITAKEAEEANESTQRLNRELLATQKLLEQASRESERTRIARDLHDLLGHHLTALTINLQVAGHITEGEAKEKVEQCHSLSKLLLNDVREAVSELRERPVVSAKELLEVAIADLPRLEVDLQVEEGLQINDVNTGQIVLRTVQEALTNTLKHTSAKLARISLVQKDQKLVFDYEDEGGSTGNITLGNGLTGMRERLEKIGGTLNIFQEPALRLNAVIPLGV